MLHLLPVVTLAAGAHAMQPANVPTAELSPVPMTSVTLEGGFWGHRLETNHTSTLPANLHQCEITGRLANFQRAAGRAEGDHEGYFFNDSDVYKIIEGASYSLALRPDPELEAHLDALIDDIAAAQEEDGYLNTYYTLAEPDAKWTNIRVRHELYCAGHLFEAAVAHAQATGKRTLLDVALRLADHIDERFGPDARRAPPGHQQIEMGLVRLYEHTGEKRYLDLARFFLDARGDSTGHSLDGEYAQDHEPVAEQTEAVGHAVRAAYMYAGMAEIVAETGNDAYKRALDRLWTDVVSRKLYITGAIGASRAGEAFGPAYDLPNDSAYAETCGAIANAIWNQRMLLLEADARYADVVERAMYNGFLVGVSLEGDTFFYPNPLATDGVTPFNHGSAERKPWFACACCPSNDVRFFPRILSYLYANDRHGNLFVNQFAAGTAKTTLAGTDTTITQRTDYPWSGTIELQIDPATDTDAAIHVRVPGWARNKPVPSDLYFYMADAAPDAEIRVNAEPIDAPLERGYAVIDRTWSPGDTVTLTLPMQPRRVLSHPAVKANRSRVTIERGPLVYCLEGVDHDGRALNLVLPDDAALHIEKRTDLLAGVTTIHATGTRRRVDLDTKTVEDVPADLTFVPYYAWNHRGATEMTVWVPREPRLIEIPPDPTVASMARVKVSHVWSSDTPRAINDQKLPADSADQTIPRHTWWPRRGTTEWAELHLAEPTEVSATSLYWFDDTGVGQCRIPASWTLYYKHDDTWQKVPGPDARDPAKDAFDTATFDPVTTDALRVEVQLQDGYSAGILEWTVNDD